MIVDHENEFEIMLDQIATGSRELEVVSIVGKDGGMGKTSLATKIYNDPYTMSHFDIRAKTTVSQEYCTGNVLLGLPFSITGMTNILYKLTEGELADRLQKTLQGRRYLIVIDDICTTTAWDDFKLFFPDYHNESHILLTTRNMEVTGYAISGTPPYQTHLSWKDLSIVGKLPNLEFLKLAYDACEVEEWKVVKEGFPYLKLLLLKCINFR